jgi:hypothetical protein
VLCADTQETVGDVRVTVNKLEPVDWGHYQLALAGSGNGDLIEGFAYALGRAIESWPEGADEEFVRESIRDLLLDYHDNEVRIYPADSNNGRFFESIICIKPKGVEGQFFLWKLAGPIIMPVGDYALIGISAAIYTHELGRLYRSRISAGQAVLLAIHLLSLAKATSNYVGGETDIVVLRPDKLHPYSCDDIRLLESRIEAFNRQMAKLVLACPDHTIPVAEFRALLNVFEDELMALRVELMHPHAVVDSTGLPIMVMGEPLMSTPAEPSREPTKEECGVEDDED